MGNGREDTWDLFRDALGGDSDGLNRLVERMRPRLVIWVSARLSAKLRAVVEPEDIAHEILISALNSFQTLRATTFPGFLKWLFRIGENTIRDVADYFGAKKRQPKAPLFPSQTTPGSRIARNEQTQIVMDALDKLPEDYRLVLRYRILEGRDTSEIAELMDRSENSIRILVCRALKAIRKILGHDPNGND